MIGIYCIENKVNHKRYIGKSNDIQERWRHHVWELNTKRHPNKHLLSAWDKYGKNAFEFYVLEETDMSMIDDCEVKWIKFFNSHKHGYNMTDGGEGQLGRCLTEKEKQYLSEINKGALNPNYGKPKSKETKRKMSESAKARERSALSQKHKQAISRALKGVPKEFNNKRVYCVETNAIYSSLSECSLLTNIPIYGISRVCSGKRSSHRGYHFRYV